MRKLMWFTIGVGTACALCAYLWQTEQLWLWAVASLVLSISAAFYRKQVKWMRCAAAVCLGCAAGFLWFQLYSVFYLSLAAELDGKMAETSAYCTDYSYQTNYGTAVEGIIRLDGKPVRAKFYVNGEVPMEPGDILQGVFEFRVTTPDSEQEATYHQGKGIFLLGYQREDAKLLKLVEKPTWTFPARLRHDLQKIMDSCFPEDAAGFAKALLLGDRTGIDYETNTAFKISGIMHIIAVSGLHVTILFTLINLLCLKRRWLVAVLGIPTLVLFAAAAGFTPSVVRACIMQGLMILAMLAQKEYDGPTELAFSCLIMLLVNPLVITSAGFQLSVGCMIGIFLLNHPIHHYLTKRWIAGKDDRFIKVKRWLISSVSVTLSAMALTTPLVAHYFGCVSLVSILSNLLTLWVISFIFYGIILVCLLGVVLPGAAAVVAALVAWPIRYVLGLAKQLAAFPLSAVYTSSLYIVAWLVLIYFLLALFMMKKKKQPVPYLCVAVLGLCLALGASWIEPLLDNYHMTVLDVGQGQCIVLQSDGKTFLVDCGGSDDEETADTAAEYLLARGIWHLDGVILTHFDKDHSGGLQYLLGRVPADVLLVPDCPDENGILSQLTSLSEQTLALRDDVQITYGITKISVFGPVVPDSGNESSLAVLFQRGSCDILITGDRTAFGERILLKTADIPRLDVLVAGHHGSKHSTCAELLEATQPKRVMISVGDNSYGHPAEELLQRLREAGCKVQRTDLQGDILYRR